jgi:hypothetical protein
LSLRGAFSRHRWLIVLGVSAEEWAKRWDLEPYTRPCGTCGRELTTTIPFACDNVRGLKCPTCPCGNECTPYCVVAAVGDLLTPDPVDSGITRR